MPQNNSVKLAIVVKVLIHSGTEYDIEHEGCKEIDVTSGIINATISNELLSYTMKHEQQ